jgi:hypothetical protein
VRFLSVTLSLFGIFIFNSPFLRVLAELISARWMVLRFTGKQVNTSYSSEQMLVMLFLCNSLDSHPTIIFKPNDSFCRPTTLHFNFLSPFLFTKYTGLNIILSGSRDLRRLLSKSLLPAMDGGDAGKRLRFIVNFW